MLIEAVHTAYEEMENHNLDNAFLSLQAVMLEVLRCCGDNDYDLPHMGKDALRRRGELRKSLIGDNAMYEDAVNCRITKALVFA